MYKQMSVNEEVVILRQEILSQFLFVIKPQKPKVYSCEIFDLLDVTLWQSLKEECFKSLKNIMIQMKLPLIKVFRFNKLTANYNWGTKLLYATWCVY